MSGFFTKGTVHLHGFAYLICLSSTAFADCLPRPTLSPHTWSCELHRQRRPQAVDLGQVHSKDGMKCPGCVEGRRVGLAYSLPGGAKLALGNMLAAGRRAMASLTGRSCQIVPPLGCAAKSKCQVSATGSSHMKHRAPAFPASIARSDYQPARDP
jgi:hypothetical protein